MSLIWQSENEIAKYNVDSLLSITIDVYDFRPTENVMSEIISSGKLDLITSDSLKNALFEWTAGLKVKEEAVETLDHMTQNLFIPYLTKNGSLKILIVTVSYNGKKSQDSKAITLSCSLKTNLRTFWIIMPGL